MTWNLGPLSVEGKEEKRVVPVPLAIDVGMEVGEVGPHLVIRLVTSTTGFNVFGSVADPEWVFFRIPDPNPIFLIA